jgi:very-short-patch-repair endonuclease
MVTKAIHNIKAVKPRRRQLRRSLTPAEALLWKNLQRSRIEGRKFRRQHSVSKYVLDFYCAECRVGVELDGDGHFHSWSSARDAERTAYLGSLNIRVLRFENRMVFEDLEAVLETIRQHVRA